MAQDDCVSKRICGIPGDLQETRPVIGHDGTEDLDSVPFRPITVGAELLNVALRLLSQNLLHLTVKINMKLEEQEIAAFCGLVVLNKPPVEDYFMGTKKKKCKKKKIKHKRDSPTDFSTFCKFVETSQTLHSKVDNTNDLLLRAQALEEKKNIERKIQKYESWMELQQQSNYRRQRHLEKHSLEKQENLVETWLGLIQRRKELKKNNSEQYDSSVWKKKCQYYRPVNISLIRKRYWNEETDKNTFGKPPTPDKTKEKEEMQTPVASKELKDEFFEKLVFVDVSDDDSS